MDIHVEKTVPVSYKMVADAYGRVRQGGKAAGIDGESWADFEAKGVEKQLYVIWNRLASGSYIPQSVREVEIPKKDGKVRKLGIPTLRDRIAQSVVKDYMEKRIDENFHESSYGYRPLRGSKDAVKAVRENCLAEDWVIDMDISKFFDEIDHGLLLKGVEAMLPVPWVLMYVKRWLETGVVKADGSKEDRCGKGTPQGGVISPLLANLFLHYGLDQWLSKNYHEVKFVRYADDAVIHCKDKASAEALLEAIKVRLSEIKLRLNAEKTKIVYCKDYRRTGNHENVQFGFLGYSYQPRAAQSKREGGGNFTAFTAEISKENKHKVREVIRSEVNWRNTVQSIECIAEKLNNKLRGWVNYFNLYGRRGLEKTMLYLELKLTQWTSVKHKQGKRKSVRMLKNRRRINPNLFYHWQRGYCQ